MDITIAFGGNVRRSRVKVGLSQEALADRAGLHRTYVGAVERGERNITLVSAQRIADALQVKLSDLVRADDGR